MNSGIYVIKNMKNNKIYIGSSVDLKKREREHFYVLTNNSHHNKHLQKAWNKYGKENFKFDILVYISNIEELRHQELLYIKLFNALDTNIGYNISEETTNPCLFGKNNGMYGKKSAFKQHSEEAKKKIALKNSNPSNETRENHRQAALNQSPEAREKIRQAKFKPVIQLSLEGEFIKKWDSIKEACDSLGFQQSSISTCCANKNNVKQHKGFIWLWEENYNESFNINDYKRPYKTRKGKITLQLDLDGNFIKEWINAIIASKELGLSYNSIIRCCSGNQSTSQGFIWQYA